MKFVSTLAATTLLLTGCVSLENAQSSPNPSLVEAYADHPMSFLFGEWVGQASGVGPDRKPYSIAQTERVGPLLDGQIVLIEGKGYDETDSAKFNAFAVVSKNARTQEWEIRSFSDGRAGQFPFAVTESGFTWSTPAGPKARMVYTATVQDGEWRQTGEYTAEGAEPRQVFQMTLKRTGDTDWPMSGAVALPETD